MFLKFPLLELLFVFQSVFAKLHLLITFACFMCNRSWLTFEDSVLLEPKMKVANLILKVSVLMQNLSWNRLFYKILKEHLCYFYLSDRIWLIKNWNFRHIHSHCSQAYKSARDSYCLALLNSIFLRYGRHHSNMCWQIKYYAWSNVVVTHCTQIQDCL